MPSGLVLASDEFNFFRRRDRYVPSLTDASKHGVEKFDAALADHLLDRFIERAVLTAAARYRHGLKRTAILLANCTDGHSYFTAWA